MSSNWTGRKPRILLSSVFGPYAQDDEFGSRSINPMELYHNQVTRTQGPFSVRMFHRSWGILMIQANISAPCAVLDFPTRDAFARELREQQYDIVGISSIIVNVGKVKEMCRLIREISPQSEIVIGGHVTAIPDIETMVDADHFVRGEGISWMRRHLGEDENAPVKHPLIPSGFKRRFLGIPMPDGNGSTSATIIPSVGCPMGCNFCTTSSFFGGKGKHHDFFKAGDELFDIMCQAEAGLRTKSFFVMDENFLLNKKRAMQLLARMKQEGKSWEFQVFSSANAIRNYTMTELVELGISWIWMGLESPRSNYLKLAGSDTIALTRELRRNGIRVLGSTIIGLEHHTPENIHAGNRARGPAQHRFPPVHAVYAGSRHAAAPRSPRAGPPARCRFRRHPRPVQVQLQAPGHLARSVEDVPRLRLPPRFRTERPQHLPHLPYYV